MKFLPINTSPHGGIYVKVLKNKDILDLIWKCGGILGPLALSTLDISGINGRNGHQVPHMQIVLFSHSCASKTGGGELCKDNLQEQTDLSEGKTSR